MQFVLLSAILLVIAPLNPPAYGNWWGSTGHLKIETIKTLGWGDTHIHFVKVRDNTNGHQKCNRTKDSGFYRVIDRSGKIFSMLMSAQTLGNNVKFWIEKCKGDYATVGEVAIMRPK
ncbi:MAG: hypothetical protein CMP10_17450 [Zetaproteobacteria bacterium]|nr:hypothetical protein [Pseudobdellovibrionaceae bacterium]|tara:strand:+ start:410 stop:760 length:351 start_codon:yes stop_codon:yes gene_type:complete